MNLGQELTNIESKAGLFAFSCGFFFREFFARQLSNV